MESLIQLREGTTITGALKRVGFVYESRRPLMNGRYLINIYRPNRPSTEVKNVFYYRTNKPIDIR